MVDRWCLRGYLVDVALVCVCLAAIELSRIAHLVVDTKLYCMLCVCKRVLMYES